MPTSVGPNPSADNSIVFSYDVGDTSNSYIGEPTVNLLYSPGATNLINGAGDIYGRCTKTDLGNGKYKFVNNGTGFSTVRVYTNQSDLINGATYGCSVYFEDLIGSISIDWCDTGITGINSSTSPSGRLGGYGTRATYDGPYYFLDINFDSGGSVTLFNPQVEYKSHITPFVAGTRSATQGLLPLISNTSIDLSNVSFDSNAQIVFDGTDDYVDLGSYLYNIDTSILSIEMVFKTNINTTSDRILLGWQENEYPHGYIVLGNFTGYWGNESISFYNEGPGTTALSFAYTNGHSFLSDTLYHHVVFILQTSNYKIYIDGVEVPVNPSFRNGSQSTVMPSNLFGYGTTPSVVLGTGSDPAGGFFNGQIPITKIYNTALSTDQVQQNYRQYKSRFNLS
jgi:hypothetical protein